MNDIVGLGELVHDAHYSRIGGQFTYVGSRGGGSVWNILANAAARGHAVGGIGTSGGDDRRTLALEDNSRLGIHPISMTSQPTALTSTMHHFPRDAANRPRRYQTTSKCLRCQQRITSAKLVNDKRIEAGPESFELPSAIFVVDQLTTLRARWARELKQNDWTTVADLGYPGYLRFRQPDSLIAELSAFDVLVLQGSVSKFLSGRIANGDSADLARRLGSIVLISDGDRGLEAFDGRGSIVHRFKLPAPASDVVDTVGAGDRLLGSLLALMIEAGHTHGEVTLSPETIEGLCAEAMQMVPEALTTVGARGHLPGALIQLTTEPHGDPAESTCPICGSSPQVKSVTTGKRSLSRSNLTQIQTRMSAIASDSLSLEDARRVLSTPKNTIFCGTGGSFAAAEALAMITNAAWSAPKSGHGSGMATAMRPLDVLASTPAVERIVGISYSGQSPDVWSALEAARLLGAEAIMVTAGEIQGSRDETDPVQVINFGRSNSGAARAKERGFVSIGAAAGPVALWVAAAVGSDRAIPVIAANESARDTELIASELAEVCGPFPGGALAVIGSGIARPAMTDIESKFTEASLAPVILHDSKDFSHGRFISIGSTTPLSGGTLMLRDSRTSEYEDHLVEVLKRRGDRIFEIRSRQSGALALLDLFLAVQAFSVHFGGAAQIDISRPGNVHQDWLGLYRWSGPLP